MSKLKVLNWSEVTEPKAVYPEGINGAVCAALKELGDVECRLADINMPEQGLSEDNLAWADVLTWFGHARHGDVEQVYVDRVVKHAKERGMGFVPLHSAHYSKPFQALMGTSCGLGGWREDDMPEYITIKAPDHPVAEGVSDFVIPKTEMYAEPFDIPEPDLVVFEGRWDKGEWFRSGCCFTKGKARIFYFRPGHETLPIFFQPEIKRLLTNAVEWVGNRR